MIRTITLIVPKRVPNTSYFASETAQTGQRHRNKSNTGSPAEMAVRFAAAFVSQC
ncbi:hypothetical protein NHH03_05600 [Stieleria sp. TO1_6]|uniref:hypothetical protein n=1 Tax=Stieleria tagensis TaxID=2956795 RepID=UPI00209AC548|nr:hypothetical protein [Stieleria tagensis]MCO8121204.1 hypothetical protein [Stieleria tagensis]